MSAAAAPAASPSVSPKPPLTIQDAVRQRQEEMAKLDAMKRRRSSSTSRPVRPLPVVFENSERTFEVTDLTVSPLTPVDIE